MKACLPSNQCTVPENTKLLQEVKDYLKQQDTIQLELEMCGLAINILSFVHLLKRIDFDAIVDHLVLTDIIRSKAELTTTRIKRLLEILSANSFNLYYIKGKDMILSNFSSRQKHDDSNPHEIIPFSFNMQLNYSLGIII